MIAPALLLAAALLLCAGCSRRTAAEEPAVTGAPPAFEQEVSASAVPVAAASRNDDRFTMRYSAANSFNPFTGTNPDNMAACRLMYESLFELGPGFEPEKLLCESWKTADGITFDFTIRDGVKFSSGTSLTAADVAYSINFAAASDRYAGRFRNLSEALVVDERTVEVVLLTVDYGLPALLDIPIIEGGSVDTDVPPGTGPYMLDRSGPKFVKNPYYRDGDKLPLEEILLKEYSSAQVTDAFASGDLDLVWDDPFDDSFVSLRENHDLHLYNTTCFQYIGLNFMTPCLERGEVRQAIANAVDRSRIAASMDGCAVPSPLLFSPGWYLYDSAAEPPVPNDRAGSVLRLLKEAGLKDVDGDGFLDYEDGYPINLRFVVYEGSSSKLAAAKMVTRVLEEAGLRATIMPLGWDEYVSALESGEFDLYYAEVMLPADFDFSGILVPGGQLNYGSITSERYFDMIGEVASAATDTARASAASALCRYAAEENPIIPVVYRLYCVHTLRGVVTGLAPTQSSVFHNITALEIDLG